MPKNQLKLFVIQKFGGLKLTRLLHHQKDIFRLKLKKCGNLTSPIFQASGTFLSYPRLCMWKIYTLLLLLQKKVYIDAPCKIESPVAYFLFSQQPLGGWPRFSIPHTSFADYSILGSFTNCFDFNLFWFWRKQNFVSIYCKVESTSPFFWAHAVFFRLSMNGKFDVSLLWTFGDNLISKLKTHVNTHNFTVPKTSLKYRLNRLSIAFRELTFCTEPSKNWNIDQYTSTKTDGWI